MAILKQKCKLHHPVSLLVIVYYLVFSFISGSRYNPELSLALDGVGSHTSMWVQFMFLDEAYVRLFCRLSAHV